MTTISDVMKSKQNYSFYSSADYGRDFPRLYTGVFAFDYCTAGIPVGVTSSAYGPPGSFKSGLLAKALAAGQMTCWNCFEFLWDCKCDNQLPKKSVIISTERFDLDWAEKLGIDVDSLIVAEPATGEEAVDIIYECLNADDCGMVGLDSLSRIIPEQEITDPALSYQVGMRARLHAKLMNKVKSTLILNKRKGVNSAFMATNQVRAVIGGFMGGEETPGGFATKHDWHLTCRLGALKPDSQFMNKETELPSYGKYSLSIVSPGIKRKLFTLAGKGQFFVALENTEECLSGTSYDFKTVFDYAKKLGLIDKKWTFLYDGIEHGTKTALMDYWRENPFEYMTVKRRIIEHAGNVKRGIIEDCAPKENKKEAASDKES